MRGARLWILISWSICMVTWLALSLDGDRKTGGIYLVLGYLALAAWHVVNAVDRRLPAPDPIPSPKSAPHLAEAHWH